MPSLYSLIIPVFLKPLRNSSAYITHAASFAKTNNVDPKEYIHGRLAPDMKDFAFQVYTFTETASAAAALASGNEVKPQPAWNEDVDPSLEELVARIDGTVKILEGYQESDFEGREGKEVVLYVYNNGAKLEVKFENVLEYLSSWSIPNFFFHTVTAYDILRLKGVELGKAMFLNSTKTVNIQLVGHV